MWFIFLHCCMLHFLVLYVIVQGLEKRVRFQGVYWRCTSTFLTVDMESDNTRSEIWKVELHPGCFCVYLLIFACVSLFLNVRLNDDFSVSQSVHWPVWLSCEVLRLRLDGRMATTRWLRLERRFLIPLPRLPSAVSDWLPSACSMP